MNNVKVCWSYKIIYTVKTKIDYKILLKTHENKMVHSIQNSFQWGKKRMHPSYRHRVTGSHLAVIIPERNFGYIVWEIL